MTDAKIIRRLSFDDYRAIDAVNISSLAHMAVSPKQYAYEKAAPGIDAQHYRVGRSIHTAVIEPMRFLDEYVKRPAQWQDWRTKAARDWRDSATASGKTVLTDDEYARAEGAYHAVKEHAEAQRIIRGCDGEVTITWTDPGTGIRCKMRTDLLADDLFADVKSTRHATAADFQRDAFRLGYWERMAWYQYGIEAATGKKLPAYVIAVQSSAPYDVRVMQMDQADLDHMLYRPMEWLATLGDCQKHDDWPGGAEEIETLELPPWAKPAQEPLELTIGGKKVAV